MVNLSGGILKNSFTSSVKVIPHPEKAYKGGEDAYFVNEKVIAVADGVGGWADYGVDPALYSKELCSKVSTLVGQAWKTYRQHPKRLLADAAGLTKSKGSSTLVVLMMDEDEPKLHYAYMGDSGYMLFRREAGDVVLLHQSEEHVKGFNFPYQLGTGGDPPSKAMQGSHDVQDQDLVVVGSDGLFDNLDDKQVKEIVQKYYNVASTPDLQLIANQLAQKAYDLSLDESYDSPFSKRAREFGKRYLGGKSDDITVAVGLIHLRNQSGNESTDASQEEL